MMSTGAAVVNEERDELAQEPALIVQDHGNMSPPLYNQIRDKVVNDSELIMKTRDKQIISADVKKPLLSFMGKATEYEEVNETINSSKLVMNKRDRQNIQDFLSANISPKGLIKEISQTNLLNDSVV